ncbi:hypothetical protein E5288_WYG016956 [Bos mutus]|uniref:Uncharacterized protein n=1 Tax=Bos mutus TaxID=72004 RepID=A0A6B0S317_9CETA|nr:hypothetical protein [Bos mutus]
MGLALCEATAKTVTSQRPSPQENSDESEAVSPGKDMQTTVLRMLSSKLINLQPPNCLEMLTELDVIGAQANFLHNSDAKALT